MCRSVQAAASAQAAAGRFSNLLFAFPKWGEPFSDDRTEAQSCRHLKPRKASR